MSTKRIIATIVSLVVALAALAMAFTIFKNVSAASKAALEEEVVQTAEKKETTTATEVPEVKVLTVENQAYNGGLSVQGRLRAYDKTDLVAEIPGMLKPVSKRFKTGTRYTKEELIFEVDDTEARLNLQAQKAQLQTAITQMMPDLKIDMPESFSNWKSYLDNFNLNSSLRAFPKSISERESYFISLKGIHAQYYSIKSGEKRLSKYQVRAPFDGIITNVNVGDSGYLRAGSPLGTIMNTSKYEMEAAVPIGDLKYVKRGGRVKVFSDDTSKTWKGIVKRIGDMIDPNSQSATIYIGLVGSGLREGQYLRAEISSRGGGQVALLPSELVQDNVVHIVAEGTIAKQAVEVVKREGGKIMVKGLEDGTKVVQDKNSASLLGQAVRIIQ